MTTTTTPARWILSALVSAALGLSIGACSDSDDTSKDTSPSTSDSGSNTPVADTGASAPSTSDSGASGGACEGVYSALSDSCSSCACKVDPKVAPACQKPCWDFLACSFAAQAGKCAASAAGGAATRPQFEACTMEECGAYLAVPGAEAVSSYRNIIGACAQPMGGATPACAGDITKFQSELKK